MQSILEDLDRISDAAEDTLVSHPSTSGPHQLPSALNLSSSEIHEALAREREGEQDAGGSKGGGGGWLSRCAEEAYGWGRWAAGRLQEVSRNLQHEG